MYKEMVLIPFSRVNDTLTWFHCFNQHHPGRDRMLALMKTRVWWPGMATDVRQFVKTCHECQLGKAGQRTRAGFLQIFPATLPFQVVHIDIVGALPPTPFGNVYLLTMMDRFTRLAHAVPLKTDDAESVTKQFLEHWVLVYGPPESLITDRGSTFMSKLMKSVTGVWGIKHKYTSPYHPETDGAVERWHGWLKERLVLKSLEQNLDLQSGDYWDVIASSIAFAYNITPHSATRFSPYELVFGKQARLPLDWNLSLLNDVPTDTVDLKQYRQQLLFRMKVIRNTANENQTVYDARKKRQADKHRHSQSFGIGTLVRYNVSARNVGNKRKLSAQWEGPYVVKEKRGDVTYAIELQHGGDHRVVHVSTLKTYHVREAVDILEIKQEHSDEIVEFLKTLREVNRRAGHRSKYPLITNKHLLEVPMQLGQFMASLIPPKSRTLELFAGNGSLTQHIQGDVLAIEADTDLYCEGSKRASNAQWINIEVLSLDFLTRFVFNDKVRFDCIICNPIYDVAFSVLLVAQQMLNPNGCVIVLLPSNYFLANENIKSLYDGMALQIEYQWNIGAWCYFKWYNESKRRKTTDSVFVIRKLSVSEDINNKYN